MKKKKRRKTGGDERKKEKALRDGWREKEKRRKGGRERGFVTKFRRHVGSFLSHLLCGTDSDSRSGSTDLMIYWSHYWKKRVNTWV